MAKVEITKNGVVIKSFICPEESLQKCFAKVHSIAGGLWNGVDEFQVLVNKA